MVNESTRESCDTELATSTFGPLAPLRNTVSQAGATSGANVLDKTDSYPDDNPKTVIGTKKPPTRSIPPIAVLHLGGAMEDGARKYGRFNWRDRSVTSSVYYDAIQRHLLSWWDGERNAADSGKHHLAHVMACCAILLDAEDVGNLNDDRRTDGGAARLVAAWTEQA